MRDSLEYIKKYGDFSFSELPFNEVDNIVFCQIFYMPMEKVSPLTFNEEPKPFDRVWKDLYSYNGNKHVAPGLVLKKCISKKMMECAKTKRYSEMKLIGVREVFKERPAVQFCAGTFILPDGKIVVVFRGTDDSIVGWKEDVDIYVKHGIPSQKLAVEYLTDVHNKYPESELIVCGHSKGGNLSLYSALASEKSVRDKIVRLYNVDGPGFDTYDWFETRAYKDLLPKYKHLVPTSSFIGMLLAHDNDFEVVKNKHLLGPLRHDLRYWIVNGTSLKKAKDLNVLGKFTNRFLNKFIFRLEANRITAFDKVTEAVMLDGISSVAFGLSDFPKNIPSALKGARKAYRSVEDEEKTAFSTCFSETAELATDVARNVAIETAGDIIENRKKEREQKLAAETEKLLNLVAKGHELESKVEQKIEAIVENMIQSSDTASDAAPAAT